MDTPSNPPQSITQRPTPNPRRGPPTRVPQPDVLAQRANRLRPDVDLQIGVVRSVNDLPLQYDMMPAAMDIAKENAKADAQLTSLKEKRGAPPATPETQVRYLDLYGRHIAEFSGVSADYMRAVVVAESSDNAHADNPASTARGLTQNTVDNWLSEVDGIRKHGPVLGWDSETLGMARMLDQMDPKDVDALVAKLPAASDKGDTFTTAPDTTTFQMRMAGLARNLKDSVNEADFYEARGKKAAPSYEDLFLLSLRTDPRWSLTISAMQARGQHQVLSERLGRDPKYWEMYAIHFGGAGDGWKIITAPDKTPIASVLKPLAIKQNASMLKGVKTAADLRALMQKKVPDRYLTLADDD